MSPKKNTEDTKTYRPSAGHTVHINSVDEPDCGWLLWIVVSSLYDKKAIRATVREKKPKQRRHHRVTSSIFTMSKTHENAA